jgi:hypothetical protein
MGMNAFNGLMERLFDEVFSPQNPLEVKQGRRDRCCPSFSLRKPGEIGGNEG